MKLLLLVLLLLVAIPAFTQQDSVKITTPGDTVVVTETWTVRQLKQFARQQRRDSIRAHKKVWLSILGGPSYNPEASLGVGGAMLMTFRMNPDDTISQRSFIPVGFTISINGTFVAAGAGTLFFNENKFRIYIKYGYRTEPANFYGIGYDEIKRKRRNHPCGHSCRAKSESPLMMKISSTPGALILLTRKTLCFSLPPRSSASA